MSKVIEATLIKLKMQIPAFAPDFDDVRVLRSWVEGLEDLPLDALGRACKHARKNCDKFPSIAELNRIALGLSNSREERKQKALVIAEKVWVQGTMSASRAPDEEGIVADVLRLMGGCSRFQQYLERDHDFVLKRAAEIALGRLETIERQTATLELDPSQVTRYLESGGTFPSSPCSPHSLECGSGAQPLVSGDRSTPRTAGELLPFVVPPRTARGA